MVGSDFRLLLFTCLCLTQATLSGALVIWVGSVITLSTSRVTSQVSREHICLHPVPLHWASQNSSHMDSTGSPSPHPGCLLSIQFPRLLS